MIYGLYLSATGVLANSYRQDVIANNLANAETVGFKRDMARFAEMRTAAQRRGVNPARHSNSMLEALGGGLSIAPTWTDLSAGEAETTGNPLDVAIQGSGYLAVRADGKLLLTRDGRLTVNRWGNLALASGGGEVLDVRRRPIAMGSGPASIDPTGRITQNGEVIAQLGLFEAADASSLRKHGASMMALAGDERGLRAADGKMVGGTVERSNVDPTLELARLMDAQRQLEANANMIRYQDQTLGRLVNDVGKIG